MRELHAIVSGKVQGVFFRAWTRDVARALALCGWVRNKADGTVEVLAQGEADALERFRTELAQGAPLSRVTGVDFELRDASALQQGFEIRR